ncbi:MAG: serine/threonine-protein kinase [bacterium]
MARTRDDHEELVALVDALAMGRPLDAEAFERLFPRDFAHRTLTRVEQIRAMLGERAALAAAGSDEGRHALEADDLGEDTIDTEAIDIPFPTAPGQHPRYGLEGLLGQGGVAEVYLARDRRLGRPVALKALRPEIGVTRRGRQRFIAESQTTARLAHPGIIPVHDAGKLLDGRLFFTMQKVEGRTLRSVLEALRAGEPAEIARFSVLRLLALFHRVCMTVAYAHDQGVVHRDLKPENILLGAYGEVYVADWGLSRPLDDENSRLTLEGEAIGTLYYMAPEQACGELEEQGAGLDVWALGVMLYELLTLERPFVGKSVINLVYVIATEPPRPARGWSDGRPLAEPLQALIDDALIKDSADRTLSARAMADRLAAWLEGSDPRSTRGETTPGGPAPPVPDDPPEASSEEPELREPRVAAALLGEARAEGDPEATVLDGVDELAPGEPDTEPRDGRDTAPRRSIALADDPRDPLGDATAPVDRGGETAPLDAPPGSPCPAG